MDSKENQAAGGGRTCNAKIWMLEATASTDTGAAAEIATTGTKGKQVNQGVLWAATQIRHDPGALTESAARIWRAECSAANSHESSDCAKLAISSMEHKQATRAITEGRGLGCLSTFISFSMHFSGC